MGFIQPTTSASLDLSGFDIEEIFSYKDKEDRDLMVFDSEVLKSINSQ